MKLRKATLADADLLLAWRNDPETRANSRNGNPITKDEHAAWMKRAVDPGHQDQLVLIAYDSRGPIGVLRFSGRDHDNYEVSIAIAPTRRGEGLGFRVLKLGCDAMKGFLVAEIKSVNLPSRKIFEKCGFEEISEHGGYMLYRRPRREAV